MINTLEKQEVTVTAIAPPRKSVEKKKRLVKSSNFDLSNVKISIDTLWIVCKLDKDELKEIFNSFYFISNPDKYHYYQTHFNSKLSILMHPVNHASHYNICIKLQNELFNKPLPDSIKSIIDRHDWMIRRIDVAYDTDIPLRKTLSIVHHGNVKLEENTKYTNTKYVGKLKSRGRSLSRHYDRNVKEEERNNSSIKHPRFNRFEVEIKPSIGTKDKILLHELTQIDHDKIIHYLDKYICIPDIIQVQATKEEKKTIIELSKDYTYKNELSRTEWNNIKEIIKANKLPLGKLYNENTDELFKYLMK